MEIEQATNTLLGPFNHNPFPDRTASSPLNSVPKWDSDKCRVILNMSFPMGTSVNHGIDKDKYLGVPIELAYLTVDAFASMVKMVGPGALVYKWDLCRAYRQIWTDPFDVPYQGFYWQGVFYFDTVLVMGCTSSIYICQRVTTALAHIHNSWGALCPNYLDDFIGVAPLDRADRDFHKLGWLLRDVGVWESEHKACPPSSMVVLGILFNTIDMTISIAPDRVHEIQHKIDTWRNKTLMLHKQLESLISKLQFASQVVRAGLVFLARLLDELQGSPKKGYFPVPEHIFQDLRWWDTIMPIFNGTMSIYLDVFFKPGALIDTDATLVGAGGVCKGHYFHSWFPQVITHEAHIIAHLERAIGFYFSLEGMASPGCQHKVCCPSGQYGSGGCYQLGPFPGPLH